MRLLNGRCYGRSPVRNRGVDRRRPGDGNACYPCTNCYTYTDSHAARSVGKVSESDFVIDYDPFRQFAIEVARAAGKVIREGAQRPIDVHSKGLRNLLTNIDLAAERTIVDAIHERYPDHDILTEETPPDQRSSRYRWVIDPLDGTGNFSRRFPCFSTSVALTLDDRSIAGAVYDPLLDQAFSASLGGGATLNGARLQATENTELIQTLIGMDWTRDAKTRAQNACIIAELVPVCGTLRICGSAALAICYVAAGFWDAYWHLCLSPWDAAAGALIVREAGGAVTDLAGHDWQLCEGPCLASNGRLHHQFLGHVNRGCEKVS
jgi:myo-inositol-1(or 4)-monophosphatase